MKKITHPRYKDYPEQPYISPDRDLESWERNPELFPYGIVEKKQMQRLPEGILPGDVIMLWRIGFDTFTNAAVIPRYFEYRYGVDSEESIRALIRLGYVHLGSATASLDALNVSFLKKILEENNLGTQGRKGDLIDRIIENIPEPALAPLFPLRKYRITPSGKEILKKYDPIVQRHGPKM